MGFADAYLLKAGLRDQLIEDDPNPGLKTIVAIPVHNESGLERCLDSLFNSADTTSPTDANRETGLSLHTEVLILINAALEAPAEVLAQNLVTLESVRAWIASHPHPSIRFYVWLDHSFGKKEAGVGLARKILMDEAARRFSAIGNPGGIIASMDADAIVDPNYLEALVDHFNGDGKEKPGIAGSGQNVSGRPDHSASGPDGCSIYFEHPLDPSSGNVPPKSHPYETFPHETFPPEVYEAIAQYELHLRYYVNAVRSTGYPYAFHTVGSAFAVRAGVYCMEGGMNRRQGGEDFYFIQKVAQRGNFSECNTTRVVPSPRPSDRVPFGTGPAVEKYLKDKARLSAGEARLSTGEARLTTYHPGPFRMLAGLFSGMDTLGGETAPETIIRSQPTVLSEFLQIQQFSEALKEIRANSASLAAFRKRFWRWFNMFRIMKFLHFAREHGYPDVDVAEAASELLKIENSEIVTLLVTLRSIDHNSRGTVS